MNSGVVAGTNSNNDNKLCKCTLTYFFDIDRPLQKVLW